MHARNQPPCWALRPIISAHGGFFIPKSFGISLELTGSVNTALHCCIAAYMRCVLVT